MVSMVREDGSIFSFAGFTLDLEKARLLKGTKDVKLRAKSFALLEHLVRQSGRVVSKDALLSAVWPDVIVTEDSLTQCVHDIRLALGSDAKDLLQTVPRRGYLFLGATPGPAKSPAQPITAPQSSDFASTAIPLSPPKLRRDGIAVLPFELVTPKSAADTFLLDGLSHDIISRLARLRNFHVIARSSSFAVRDLAGDPTAAGTALGVAYVLTGRARIDKEIVTLDVSLVDCADGNVVWSEDFADRRDIYGNLLMSVVDRLIHALQREITTAERNRALLTTLPSLDSWQAYHRGLFHMLQFSSAELQRAESFFDLSVDLDPSFSRAHSALSYCHFLEAFLRPTDQRGDTSEMAMRSAARAMQLDEQSPASRWAYGRALWLNSDTDAGILQLRTAVDISPSFAMGYQSLSFFLFQSGNPSDAIDCADAAENLSPFDPFLCAIHGAKAMAFLRQGKIDQAVTFAVKAAQQHNVHKHILAITAVTLVTADRMPEADRCLARIRKVAPDYSLTHFRGAFMALSEDAQSIVNKAAQRIGLS